MGRPLVDSLDSGSVVGNAVALGTKVFHIAKNLIILGIWIER